MPLRIAFDMDGVVADMDAALVRHAEQLFGESVVRAGQARPPKREQSVVGCVRS